jgi:glycosyl transferase family 92
MARIRSAVATVVRPTRAIGRSLAGRGLVPKPPAWSCDQDPRDSGRAWYLGVCAIFKNEADYLAEWIRFHRLVGVEKFILYNNNSEDDYRSVLDPFIEEGIVTLYDIPLPAAQMPAYNSCLELYRSQLRWIAFIDIDEFLYPVEDVGLAEVLRDYEEHPALAVHWIMFATSGHVVRPQGLVIDNYARCQAEGNKHVKIVAQAARTAAMLGPHTVASTDGQCAVDESGRPVTGPSSLPVCVERIRINHYWTRSVEDFVTRKLARGRASRTTPDPQDAKIRSMVGLFDAERMYSTGEDPTIRRYIPRLQDAVDAVASG